MSILVVASLAACSAGDCPPDVTDAPASDPLATKQWLLNPLGVRLAWSRVEGGRRVIVAIADNGFDVSHPDLAGRLWTNPGEVPGNGVDDDGNGHTDDIHGWSFLDDTADLTPNGDPEADTFDHGTAVAGIIAAETDNGIGVAGLCPVCDLVLLEARDFDRVHTVLPYLGAIVDYAIAAGAVVLSISDGRLASQLTPAQITAVETAMARAAAADLLVVASAGNDAAQVVRYPARIPSVLGIGAVDPTNAPAATTSYGAGVDLAAPGECVQTTAVAGYRYFSGTSAAAPIVAALAGILRSLHSDWSAEQVAERIVATTTTLSPGAATEIVAGLGSGSVDFDGATAGQ